MNELFSFGAWLRQRRRALDLTQAALAEKAGCATVTVRRIEADARRPSKELAALLAAALEIAPAERDAFIQAARAQLAVDKLPAPNPLAARTSAKPAPRRRSLPTPLTPLVGREQEFGQLRDLLRQPEVRLVTLTGAGGIGKTRLAIEVAAALVDEFRDGVAFVPLVAVNDAALIASSIIDALGIRLERGEEAEVGVRRYLQTRELLLVLDNLEQIVDGAGTLVDLLASAPGVKLMATSRVRLKLQAEWVIRLEGLHYPIQNGPIQGKLPQAVGEFAAIRLFAQTASRLQPSFALNATNRQAILHICHLLEGLPLGIELAASWVGSLTCSAIAQEIERGLDILTNDQPRVTGRHRSLKAAFEQSWRLLTDSEQQAFSALTLFRGGFRRDAARAVASLSVHDLANFVDRSLLRFNESGRYEMHELMRQFAKGKRSAFSAHPVANADQPTDQYHAHYYLNLLADHESALHGEAPQRAVALLSAELDNLRQAWNGAVANKEWALLWQALPAWMQLYVLRGAYSEARRWLEQALARLAPVVEDEGDSLTARLHGYLLIRLAETLIMGADYLQAQARAEAADALADRMDDPILKGLSQATLGAICQLHRAFEQALAHQQRALRLLQQASAERQTAQLLLQMGKSYEHTHQWARALAVQSEALGLFQTLGDRWGIAASWGDMGSVYYGAGNLAQALVCHHKALEIATLLEAKAEIVIAFAELGKSYWRLEQYEEALNYLHGAIALAEELGLVHHLSSYHRIAGEICWRNGQRAEAHAHMEAALKLAIRAGATTEHVEALWGVNSLHRIEGAYHAALHNAEQALQLARGLGEPQLIALGLGHVGELNFALGQLDEARLLLEQTVEQLQPLVASPNAPLLPHYILILADVLLHQGHVAAAETRCAEAERLLTTHGATLFAGKALALQAATLRARCRYAQGEREEAIHALAALRATTDDPHQLAALCELLWQLDQDAAYAQEALAHYRRCPPPSLAFREQRAIETLEGQVAVL